MFWLTKKEEKILLQLLEKERQQEQDRYNKKLRKFINHLQKQAIKAIKEWREITRTERDINLPLTIEKWNV